LSLTEKPLVAAHQLCVERSGRSVLHEITLEINHGETVALLGANGSGKSTLLQALVDLIPLSSGLVKICAGHDSQSGIALVPQFAPPTSLIPLTVFELVSAGLTNRSSYWGASRLERKQVFEAIDSVGLSKQQRYKYSSLSGGQLRRALIARALVSQADLLLLDEPLAGLDRESVISVVILLKELKQAGYSMVVVSHELSDLDGLFTRVIELENRKIKYDGIPLDRHHQHTDQHHQHPNSDQAGIAI